MLEPQAQEEPVLQGSLVPLSYSLYASRTTEALNRTALTGTFALVLMGAALGNATSTSPAGPQGRPW